MHARVRDRLSLENDLRRAVANNDFEVVYQPIVTLHPGCARLRVAGALDPQWRAGVTGHLHSDRRGARADRAARHLGQQQACQTFAGWQRRYPQAGLDYITVNVSSRQLMQQNFVRVVQQAVEKAGLKPADLRVEITETALMDSPGEAAGVLRELRDFGAKVYLDDFGTGYSSLSHLHKLRSTRSRLIARSSEACCCRIVPRSSRGILALARTLNTSVVAEGIESEYRRVSWSASAVHTRTLPLLAPAVEDSGRGGGRGVSAARAEGHGRSRLAAAGGLTHSADGPARPSRRRALNCAQPGHARGAAQRRETRDGRDGGSPSTRESKGAKGGFGKASPSTSRCITDRRVLLAISSDARTRVTAGTCQSSGSVSFWLAVEFVRRDCRQEC